MIRRALAALVCLAMLSAPLAREAYAQAPPADSSAPVAEPKAPVAEQNEAEALFIEGRRLYDEKKFDESCKKLEESRKIRATVNTVGLLAACYEEQGKFATALREYLSTEELARATKDPRADFAHQQAEMVRPKAPILVIRVAQSLSGLTVSRNGDALPEGEVGKEALVDPGQIEIVARAPGRREWRNIITIAAGSRVEVEVPELSSETRVVTPPKSEGMSMMRLGGLVAGGVGVVAIGVGSGLGAGAIAKKKESDDKGCDAQSVCPPEGVIARNQSRTLALGSTIGFVAGIAGVGAGVALFFLGANKPAAASSSATGSSVRVFPAISSTEAGAVMVGVF